MLFAVALTLVLEKYRKNFQRFLCRPVSAKITLFLTGFAFVSGLVFVPEPYSYLYNKDKGYLAYFQFVINEHFYLNTIDKIHKTLYVTSSMRDAQRLASRNVDRVMNERITTERDSFHLVLIIGETHLKHHSHIYGYPLQNTPLMEREQERGNLVAFDDVITTENLTTNAMRNIFFTNTASLKEDWSEGVLFPAIFHRAGYNIYFWDNQEGEASKQGNLSFASCAYIYSQGALRNHVYTAMNKTTSDLDMTLVNDYKQNCKVSGKRNFHIFHLIGQHFDAKDHYPHIRQFERFKTKDIKRNEPYMTDDKRQAIVEYANATLYNDYVLKQIIDIFRNKNAVVVYIGDHGEEIYDYWDYCGRGEKYTDQRQWLKYEFEVPMYVWASDKFRKGDEAMFQSIKRARHKPFSTDNIYNVLLHLARIDTRYYRKEFNPLSPDYKPMRRMVLKSVWYD